MLTNRFRHIALALTVLSLLLFAGCASLPLSISEEKKVLRLGTETDAASHESRGAQKLADLVRERSGGSLEIQVYPNAKLGSMRDRNENMRMGTVDMGTSSVGFLSTYEPLTAIFDSPYLYQSKAHEMRVFDGPIGREIDKSLQKSGLRVLCYFDAGARQITNNRKPVRTVQDLKGLRLRVPQSQASIEGLKILGATPTPLPFSETYDILRQQVLDGQENPISLVFHNKLYEVQKYLSLTNHQYFIQMLLISEKTWQTLSKRQQTLLLDAAKEAQSYERELVASEEAELLYQLSNKGLEINEVENPEEFFTKARPLRELYVRRYGQQAKALLEQIDALRQ